ncbi:putative polysaccharide biosynthesis protein [Bacillus massiliigorillae]|uniref:putative polysaccharide biosynthesis protein n=1 Tax=Bacillus massiliigorillae TaxID=1243664 RepID=UPI00039F0B1A|nr:polysaccharide biosynthesis protein [Bacillus massiliigorillae]
MANKLLKGTMLLSAASLLSKILGFIYIIPFTNLVGTSGYALYKYAYGPYTIMISLSTMGIPLAISKMVSKYNQLGKEDIVQKIFKYGIIAMIFSGFAAFVILYNLSPTLARMVVDQHSDGNSIESVTYVIRMVSFALLLIPPMSFLRGFFQGFQTMGPSAVSTFIEQLTRVFFILIGVFIAIKVFHSSITKAVGIGTFGAFIGALFSIGILLFGIWRKKDFFFKSINQEQVSNKISIQSIYKEMIMYSIPFVIIGLTLPIYQNIDTFTINKILMNIGYSQVHAETVNSVVGLAQILVLIPVSITTGLSVSIIPTITKSFIQKDFVTLRHQMNQCFLMLTLLIFPASLGIFILAEPLYFVLFGESNSPGLGGHLLSIYAPAAILIAFYGVTSSILQAINQHKKLIYGLLLGILIKIILNIVLPHSLHEEGFIIATYCGYFSSLAFNVYLIYNRIGFNFKSAKFRLISYLLSTFTMTLLVLSVEKVMNDHVNAYVIILICSLLGIIIYVFSIFGLNYFRLKRYLNNMDY